MSVLFALALLAPPPPPMDHSLMDHGGMGAGEMESSEMDPSEINPSEMESSDMESSDMDPSAMDHGTMDHGAMVHPQTTGAEIAPPGAGSGRAHAADRIWGADAMRASRAALARENGGMNIMWFQADRAEYRARQGMDGYLWDVQAFYGGDTDRLWLKSEGEGSFDQTPEHAEVQALYSHAIGPWFDLQTGLRQDLTGPDRTYAVAGLQGLAPYRIELDMAAFISNKGDLTARIEAEQDQRITQRLILQPRVEIGLSAQDIPELGIGAGVSSIEAGLRLRYHMAREFAPYVGFEQEWRFGDFAADQGGDRSRSSSNFVAGMRVWF